MIVFSVLCFFASFDFLTLNMGYFYNKREKTGSCWMKCTLVMRTRHINTDSISVVLRFYEGV